MDFGLLLLIVFILAPLLERLLGLGRGQQQQPPQPGQRPGRQPGQRQPGQRRPGQPGTPQPQRRVPAPVDEEEVPFRSVPAGHADGQDDGEDAAAAMLPDDLWEILTGEKRPPARQDPRREPVDAAPPPVTPVPVPRPPDAAQRRDEQFRLEQQRDVERRAEERRAAERERERIRNRPAGAPRERRLPPVDVRTRAAQRSERRPAGPPPSEADRLVRKVPVRAAREAISYDEIIPGDEERHTRFHQRLDREAADAAAAAAAARGPQVELFEDREALRKAIIMSEVLGRPRGLE